MKVLIVVPDETAAKAVHLAERCRREVAKACIAVHDETVAATASFGVADVAGATSLEALMKRADDALYRAKEAGRNQVQSCDVPAAGPPMLGPANPDALPWPECHPLST